MNYFILAAAILPAFILAWYIHRRDKYQPEPASQLVKGFLWGVLSVIIALIVATPLSMLCSAEGNRNIFDCAYQAFFCAAIPEECAKALCLWLFLRKNKYYDEYMDGIVYAVAVGMGFAALENIFYLFGNTGSWVSLGITRGLLSVPGHFAFAVLMGYYYSLWRIDGDAKSLWMMLAAPILAHGLFDLLLFYMQISESLSVVLLVVFFVFLNKLRKRCSRLIEAHLAQDKEREA